MIKFIVLISLFFRTPNSLVYSFPFQKSGLVNFCVTLARHLLRILCTACSSPHNQLPPFVYFLFSRSNTESYAYLLQFKSYSDQRTPHRLPPQKHKLTTKQPKTQETTMIMVTSARCSTVASILMVSKIALCRTIDNDRRNTAMQILYVQLTFPLFYLLLFYTARLSELAD